MRLTQHIVVGIVRWSNLQTARTKLDIYITVFDNRNYATYQRNNHLLALQPLVLLVLRVDTHCGIAHDGLRTCGSNHSVVAFLVLVDDVALSLQSLLVVEISKVSYIIFQVIQL